MAGSVPRASASILLCAAAAAGGPALSGCGESAPSDDEQVRATLTRFADATRTRDYPGMCEDVLAPALVRDIQRAGLPCAAAMEGALGDIRRPELAIGRVRVDGDRASAEVRTSAAGQEPSRDVVQLVRVKDGWRIASLAGASPPSPGP